MRIVAARNETATAEAAAWLARLQRQDVGEADGLEFEAWLSAAPDNREAYKQALSLWHEFDAGAAQVLAELERPAPRLRPAAARGPTRRWMMAGGFAAAAGVALAVMPALQTGAVAETYSTGKGQHRRVALEDGSVLDLNAETRLTVTLTKGERQVVLAEGEAIFDVAHDARRPFTVAAAGREVRVLGTRFDVKSRDGDLTVVVASGKVQVRPTDAAKGTRAYLLTPGQRLDVARTGAIKVHAVDPQEAFSWRAGRLVYRDAPLGEVVEDLNRQFVRQIEIGDPELAEIPITGVIVLDDPNAVTQRLSLMLPVRSVPSERGLLLLKK